MNSAITKEELCNVFNKSVFEDITLATKVFENVDIKKTIFNKFHINHDILINPVGSDAYCVFETNNPILLGYHKYNLRTKITIDDIFSIDMDKLIELHNPKFNNKILKTKFYKFLKQKTMNEKIELSCIFKLNFSFSVIYADELVFTTINPHRFIKDKYNDGLQNKIIISGFIDFDTIYDKVISSGYRELDDDFVSIFSPILNSVLYLNVPILIIMDDIDDYTETVNEIAEHPYKIINYTTIDYAAYITNFFKKHYEYDPYLELRNFIYNSDDYCYDSTSDEYVEKYNLMCAMVNIEIFDYVIRKFFTDFSGDRLRENLRNFVSS